MGVITCNDVTEVMYVDRAGTEGMVTVYAVIKNGADRSAPCVTSDNRDEVHDVTRECEPDSPEHVCAVSDTMSDTACCTVVV